MYSMNEIHRLQTDEEFFIQENEKYCLVSLDGKDISLDDVKNQCNFIILTIITHLKRNFINPIKANRLIEELDALEYSASLIGFERTIKKINKEIVEGQLRTPYFNQLCIVCDDLYDFDKRERIN